MDSAAASAALPDDGPSITEQREQIHSLSYDQDSLGESSYLIDAKWWILLKQYLKMDKDEADTADEVLALVRACR
jgi:hypothetical protein